MLNIRDFAVSFRTRRGEVQAVRGISLDLSEGETLGIVGESGSGKSVTSYALMRVLDAGGRIKAGSAIFDGRDLAQAAERDMQAIRGREISMIFQNPRAALNPIRKVSGLLDIGGETRLFTRLPSRTGNLRGEADAVLPETAIASFLGGLSLDDYRSLLCLDDDTIEKGGEDIASAQGDIGRLLFSAAAGVADLNAVLEQARSDASSIYKKGVRSTRVADLKRELGEVEAEIRNLDVSAHAWRKLKDALETAKNDEAKARDARNELRTEQARITALRRVLPNLGEMDRLADEIADCADYPERIDFNPEDLVTMRTDRGQADAELRRLLDELDEAEKARSALVIDADRLNLTEKLNELDELRSRMQTAALDLPRRERAHAEALSDMARIAQELGAHEDCAVTDLGSVDVQDSHLM